MTFKSGAPTGRAVLAPCKCETETINDLIFEAQALWNAEAPKSSQNAIGSVWGCVGVLFKNDRIRETLATGWSTYFKQMRSHGLSVVNSEGLLNIVWPTDMAGEPVDVDIILATATTPKILPPTAGEIANAWMNQSNGHEHYFFENVHHGIRTDADTEIWRCIERGNPPWLTLGIQKEMAVKLNSEA